MLKSLNIRWNVLGIAFLGIMLVGGLAQFFPNEGDLVIAIAGALVGGFAAMMRDLVEPDPNPMVPESAVKEMLDTVRALTNKSS